MASCRVDELRQKCQEKQGGLGIKQIDEHALTKDASEPWLIGDRVLRIPTAAA